MLTFACGHPTKEEEPTSLLLEKGEENRSPHCCSERRLNPTILSCFKNYSVCYKKVGPCGGVASAEPTTTLEGGRDFTILFQQNLNHYYLENPGQLVADFATTADPTEEDFTPLGAVSDYNAVSFCVFVSNQNTAF